MKRVLIAEPIAEAGVALLRERFDVDVEPNGDLDERIGGYDAIVIRSATKLTADVLRRADRLKVIGRAGVGVDNVDVDAATRRGIVVANAPESNVVSAAEHTVGLLLALARNIPQAHAALTAGRWERARWGGVELAKRACGVTRSTGDQFVWPLAVGTAIGRLGCFFTGLDDHTYGTATRLPWGVDFGDGILRPREGGDASLHELPRDQRPGGVVHDRDRCLRSRGEGEPHRLRPRGAARDPVRPRLIARRDGHHHAVADGLEHLERPVDQRPTGACGERLGHILPKSLTAAGGGNDPDDRQSSAGASPLPRAPRCARRGRRR